MRTHRARSGLEGLLSHQLIQSMMRANNIDIASIGNLFCMLARQRGLEAASARAWHDVRRRALNYFSTSRARPSHRWRDSTDILMSQCNILLLGIAATYFSLRYL